MLPPNLKVIGVRNLLRHFPELAHLVLVSFEGGSAAEAAAQMGLPEELGRYVDTAVRALEREVLQEVFAALLNDGDFQKNLYRWISVSTVSSPPEAGRLWSTSPSISTGSWRTTAPTPVAWTQRSSARI